MTRGLVGLLLAWAAGAQTGVVDRVAVVVGNQAITESEVILEARLEAFLNEGAVSLGPVERKAAAERLVDQQLIRNEMELGGYAMPEEKDGDAVLRNFRQKNYRSTPAFRAALEKYGLTEDELKRHLLWQAAAMKFTEQRFQFRALAPADNNSADRASDGAALEDQMDAWLKQARSGTRIQFKEAAFQ